jgi:DNA-binding transcriptional LysR family regulator
VLFRSRADFPAVTYSVLAVPPADIPHEVATGRADLGFTFVSQPPAGTHFMASITAPIGVVMHARHPLARRRQISFDEARLYPILAQQGPLPKSADIDPAFAAFRESVQPKLVSNAIQTLKQAIRRNMGIAFFTRLGFLQEIEEGEIAWRPFASRKINTLKLGMILPTARKLPFVSLVLADRLAAALKALEKPGSR